MKKIILLIMYAFATLLLVACSTATTLKKEPKEKGQTMILALATNPSTGFDWEFEFEEGEGKGKIYLEKLENEFPNDGRVGQGGFRVYFFKATASGPQKLTFTYRRPWEGGETAYDVVYELNVDDDLNIEWFDKKKGVIESEETIDFFPDPRFE